MRRSIQSAWQAQEEISAVAFQSESDFAMQSGLWAERSAGDRRSCKRFPDWWAALRRSIQTVRQAKTEISAAIFQREAGFARLAVFGRREARAALFLQAFSDRWAALRRSIQSTWQAQAKQTRLLFKRNRVCKATRPLGREKRGRRFLRRHERFSKIPAEAKRRSPPPMFWPPAGSGANGTRASAEAHFGGCGPGDVRETASALFLGTGKTAMAGSGSEAEPHAIFVFKGASTDVVPAAGRFRSTQRCCAPLPNRVGAKSIRIILSETRFLRLCHRLALQMFEPAHKTCESSAKRRLP